MPEFRKDPVVERWVIIASDRAKRPQRKPKRAHTRESGTCPFCAGNESMTPPPVLVLPGENGSLDGAGWSVRVVPNKYPALISGRPDPAQSNKGYYHLMNAAGVHEVVIETPQHVTELAALSELEMERILQAYHQRMFDLSGDARWRYILVYKNQGAEAGATLSHGHSQVAALPMIPREPLDELEAAKNHYAATGQCVYCEILRRERESGARVVLENDRFLVFCPFASRVAGETWIVPTAHSSSFVSLAQSDLTSSAHALLETMRRLSGGFRQPAFNYFLHTNPLHEPDNGYYHWHLEVLPKLQYVAGFEWGSGMYMNSLPPEHAARLLRDVAI
jgi:UDPglucose--hexose-1-phosphate uridylyltransferase